MSKHPSNNSPENNHEKLTILDLPTSNENVPKVRIDVPSRKGNEAIKMSDLKTPSPNQGLYFHYDLEKHAGGDNYEDEYVAVEIKPKTNAEKHGHVNSSYLAAPETSDANTKENVRNDESTPKKIPRSFKAPTNTEYDDDHYCLGNNDEFDSNQVTAPVQKAKTNKIPFSIGFGTVVIVMLAGSVCAALFLQPSENKKTANDTGKLFQMIQANNYYLVTQTS